jgi:hypothetical protein
MKLVTRDNRIPRASWHGRARGVLTVLKKNGKKRKKRKNGEPAKVGHPTKLVHPFPPCWAHSYPVRFKKKKKEQKRNLKYLRSN